MHGMYFFRKVVNDFHVLFIVVVRMSKYNVGPSQHNVTHNTTQPLEWYQSRASGFVFEPYSPKLLSFKYCVPRLRGVLE